MQRRHVVVQRVSQPARLAKCGIRALRPTPCRLDTVDLLALHLKRDFVLTPRPRSTM